MSLEQPLTNESSTSILKEVQTHLEKRRSEEGEKNLSKTERIVLSKLNEINVSNRNIKELVKRGITKETIYAGLSVAATAIASTAALASIIAAIILVSKYANAIKIFVKKTTPNYYWAYIQRTTAIKFVKKISLMSGAMFGTTTGGLILTASAIGFAAHSRRRIKNAISLNKARNTLDPNAEKSTLNKALSKLDKLRFPPKISINWNRDSSTQGTSEE